MYLPSTALFALTIARFVHADWVSIAPKQDSGIEFSEGYWTTNFQPNGLNLQLDNQFEVRRRTSEGDVIASCRVAKSKNIATFGFGVHDKYGISLSECNCHLDAELICNYRAGNPGGLVGGLWCDHVNEKHC